MKKWVLGTGEISGSSYLPLHRSMLENPGFVAYLDENPRYAEAVGLLKSGVIEPQLAGQQEVRGILEDVYLAVLRGEDVPTILKDAALRATQVYHRWDR